MHQYQDNGQPIDEKLYLGGTQIDSLLLETTKTESHWKL